MNARTEPDNPPARQNAQAIVPVEPRWLTHHESPPSPLPAPRRLRRITRRFASADDASPALAQLGKAALELKNGHDTERRPLAVAVTGTVEGDRHGFCALGLASTWARWGYPTLLVDLGGLRSAIGKPLGRTGPSLSEIIDAIESNSHLPIPPQLDPDIPGLDVAAGLAPYSLARLCDSGLLKYLRLAFDVRYQRVVWSLPPTGPEWSATMLKGAIDRFILSIRQGAADVQRIESLAHEVARLGLPPLELIWHHR